MKQEQRRAFYCSAGMNFAVVDESGDVFQCTNFMREPKQIRIGNVYRQIRFRRSKYACREPFCICPQYKHDPELFAQAASFTFWRRNTLPYDAWLHWLVTEECFFSCPYCAAGQRPYSRAGVRPIDIDALLKTLDQTGKIFRLSFTGGGEPMAVPNILEACAALTRRHYISFNTNLVGVEMERFIGAIDCRRVLVIQASAHLQELDRTNNFERFFLNYRAWRDAGVPIYVNAVAYPPVFAEVARYRDIFARNGVELVFAPYSGSYAGKTYPRDYSADELRLLGMSEEVARIHEVTGDNRLLPAVVNQLVRVCERCFKGWR